MTGQNVDLDQDHILNLGHLLTQLCLRETDQGMTSHAPLKIGKRVKMVMVREKRDIQPPNQKTLR